jgi:hypothetical protein
MAAGGPADVPGRRGRSQTSAAGWGKCRVGAMARGRDPNRWGRIPDEAQVRPSARQGEFGRCALCGAGPSTRGSSARGPSASSLTKVRSVCPSALDPIHRALGCRERPSALGGTQQTRWGTGRIGEPGGQRTLGQALTECARLTQQNDVCALREAPF